MRNLIIAFLLSVSTCFGQENLVPNGDFATCVEDGQLASYITRSPPWLSAGSSLPDFYKHGNNFVGFYMFSLQPNIREYIEVPLLDELESCKTYEIRFQITLDRRSVYGIDHINVGFTQSKIKVEHKNVLDMQPTITHKSEKLAKVDQHWYEVIDTFKVNGGERYMTIGNFFNDANTNAIIQKKHQNVKFAYYFIDNIRVREIPSLSDCNFAKVENVAIEAPPFEDIDEPLKEQVFRFYNIEFEIGSDELLSSSYVDLLAIAQMLTENPNIHIQIDGHTDSKGNETINQQLSEKRAEKIAQYLVASGIDKTRLTTKGYGSTSPISDNESDSGRRKNRRVEVKILSQL